MEGRMQNFICLKCGFAFFFLFVKGRVEMKYIVITGASSGIGEAMCYAFAKRGYSLIIVARQQEKLELLSKALKSAYNISVTVMSYDLSDLKQVELLYQECRPYQVVGLVNNAGYGLYGYFDEIDLNEELNMIDLNIKSLHMLTKLFLMDFMASNEGYLLNVASTAAFQSGPVMASYYASKGYVLQLTEAIAHELQTKKSQVKISVLCPGPVDTNFQQRAHIKTASKKLPTAAEVAELAAEKLLEGQLLIVPGSKNRLLLFLNRFIPRKWGRELVYRNQLKKR